MCILFSAITNHIKKAQMFQFTSNLCDSKSVQTGQDFRTIGVSSRATKISGGKEK